MSLQSLLIGGGVLLALPAVLSRCWFLAPSRLGFLFYLPCVVKDFFPRRLRLPRALGDTPSLVLGLVGLEMSGSSGVELAFGALGLVTLLEILLRARERHILATAWTDNDPRWRPPTPDGEPPLAAGVGPDPSPRPELTVNLFGPFVRRRPAYHLGSLTRGRTAVIEVVVANHTRVTSQTAPSLGVESRRGVSARLIELPAPVPLRSGDVGRWRVAVSQADGSGGKVILRVSCGPERAVLEVGVGPAPADETPVSAAITRYPGACRAAFAWRGDMDHYDTATFQSIEGLEATLRLAARYCVPQSMYLSTRLTLDAAGARAFYEHFGVERGAEEIPAFIEWIKEHVELRHSAPYPFRSAKPFVVEIGNHMHLHYGTDAAAAPENGWRRGAGICSGDYSWTRAGGSSFEEQRDNALEARRRIELAFGFTPRSWAMPDSTRDAETPRAVQAAGCDVTSDADGRHVDNILVQPPPHLATGSTAVELTKRYPGDPETLVAAEMIRFWMHRAWRRGIPVVFMCHQHMRQFAGDACARFTEYVLRSVLSDFNGDLHVDTVFGIGAYWRAALGPEHGTVSARIEGGVVRVENRGDLAFAEVPVDVVFRGGERATLLVDLPPGSTVTVPVSGSEQDR